MQWTMKPIRGGEFFRNPPTALQPLWSRLAELGIAPVESESNVEDSDLVEEIRLIAARYLGKLNGSGKSSPGYSVSEHQSGRFTESGDDGQEERETRSPLTPESEQALRLALIKLRDEVIMRAQPTTPRERGLLRMRMLQALLHHLPTSVERFYQVVPKPLRLETDPAQPPIRLESRGSNSSTRC